MATIKKFIISDFILPTRPGYENQFFNFVSPYFVSLINSKFYDILLFASSNLFILFKLSANSSLRIWYKVFTNLRGLFSIVILYHVGMNLLVIKLSLNCIGSSKRPFLANLSASSFAHIPLCALTLINFISILYFLTSKIIVSQEMCPTIFNFLQFDNSDLN